MNQNIYAAASPTLLWQSKQYVLNLFRPRQRNTSTLVIFFKHRWCLHWSVFKITEVSVLIHADAFWQPINTSSSFNGNSSMDIFHACNYSHRPIVVKSFVFQKLTLTSAFQIKLSGYTWCGNSIAGSQGGKSVSVHSSLNHEKEEIATCFFFKFAFCCTLYINAFQFSILSQNRKVQVKLLTEFNRTAKVSATTFTLFWTWSIWSLKKEEVFFQGWFNDSMRGDPDETWEGLDPDDIGDWQNPASVLLSSSPLFHNEQHFDKNWKPRNESLYIIYMWFS